MRKKYNHRETENLMMSLTDTEIGYCMTDVQILNELIKEKIEDEGGNIGKKMKIATDLEVCEKIIALAREVIKDNGGHDIHLIAKDSRGKVMR